MLQGTFETLSLPEVFGLLAGARKTGALYLDAGEVSGLVHLADGHCHAADSREQHGPLSDGGDLLLRLVDLCFTSMCQPSGSFRFEADEPAPWSCPEAVELSDALVEVDRLLKQWREILRVIPSLECRPQLLDTLEVDELVFDREGWTLLVAMDGRRTVRELVQRTNRPVIELCQSLLELIDAGAIGVIDPAAAYPEDATVPEAVAPEAVTIDVVTPAVVPPETASPEVAPAFEAPPDIVPTPEAPAEAAEAAEAAPAPAVVLTIVPDGTDAATEPGPVPETPVEPAANERPPAEQVAAGSEPPDKGAFLRLFSGLRDS